MEPGLLEHVDCILCERAAPYSVLRPAQYPPDITADGLAATYSASSEQVLFDQVVRCDQCSLVYLNPRVRADLIGRGYADAVDPTFVAQDACRIATFTTSLRRLARRHGLRPAETRILDVGCAGGAFPRAAADLGFQVVGVEPSAWLAAEGARRYGLDIRAGTLEELALPPASFDVVTLWDVIEHLPRPDLLLTEVRRLLRPDGLLVVNYPDLDGLVRRVMGWRWPFFLNVHLTYFTPATIRRLVLRHGFEPLGLEPHWQTLELGHVLRRAELVTRQLRLARRAVERLGLARLPVTYNLSQTLLVARRRA